jgi:hypothetical protein
MTLVCIYYAVGWSPETVWNSREREDIVTQVGNLCHDSSFVDCVWNVMAHDQKPDFVFRRNGRVHLNRRWRQFSRLLAAGVCASTVVMLDTPCSEVVWRVLTTHSIRQFPLHFPSHASTCAIIFQLDSKAHSSFFILTVLTQAPSACCAIINRAHLAVLRRSTSGHACRSYTWGHSEVAEALWSFPFIHCILLRHF